MVQEILVAVTVACAAMYLMKKLVLEPATRSAKPDVPTRALVRKRRSRDHHCR
jgi:hypothetical protein